MPTRRRRLPASPPPARRRPWPLLLAALALAVTGCAQAPAGPGPSQGATASSAPATVTVGPADGGRTVDLRVGDRLVVRLDTAGRPARLPPTWTLRLPSSGVLERIQADPDPTRVVLVAAGAGTVRLLLVKRASCSPPLRCPVAAAGPGGGERMRPPLAGATVAITVRVR
jgi:ferric-dicitrate binding protein FerR (iron transport regulator)